MLVTRDSSADPVPQVLDVEVDEQSDAFPTEFQVREQLRLVNGKNRFDRFDLDDHFVLNDEIDAISKRNGDVVVDNRKWLLSLERQTEAIQFVAQTYLVGTFKQAGTESGMHLVGRAQHAMGYPTMNQMVPVSTVRIRALRGVAIGEQLAGRQ